MKKLILASVAAVGMLGLAACSDTDETTTQGVPPATTAPSPTEPGAAPPADNNMGGGNTMAPAPAPGAPAE